jgi:hypothetical protein
VARVARSEEVPMRDLLQDLRYGLVLLAKHFGATATVVVSLALAIGLNATFFSFLNAFLYRPLRLGETDRLGREFMLQPLRDTGGAGPLVWGPALLALVLALVGLYGLVAYSVSQRTADFGIRIALGARPSDVASLVLREAAALTIAGSLVGLIASLGVARVLAGLFYEVRPFEPLVIAVVLPLLMLCGVLACCGPARRAVRLDPIRALRCE